jgi:hypothetical protein
MAVKGARAMKWTPAKVVHQEKIIADRDHLAQEGARLRSDLKDSNDDNQRKSERCINYQKEIELLKQEVERLKKERDEANHWFDGITARAERAEKKARELVEAAEKVIARSIITHDGTCYLIETPTRSKKYCDCGANKIYEAWREAAGK